MNEINTISPVNAINAVNEKPLTGNEISRNVIDGNESQISYLENAAAEFERSGDPKSAAICYWKAFKVGGYSAHRNAEKAVYALIDCGAKETALKIIEAAREKIPCSVYERLAAEIYMLPDARTGESYPPGFIEKYLDMFSSREGVYAVQYLDASQKTAYRPVREIFNAEVLKSHLNGDITVGLYPVMENMKVRWIAFDIDVSRRFIECSDENSNREKLEKAKAHAARISERLIAAGINPLIEYSGYKGYHIWCFFEKPIDSSDARALAERINEFAGDTGDADISVEIFPKQSSVSENGLGNLIKIPLGIHQKTGRRCGFLSSNDLSSALDPLSAIMNSTFVNESIVNFITHFKPAQGCGSFQSIKGIPKIKEKTVIERSNKNEIYQREKNIQAELFDKEKNKNFIPSSAVAKIISGCSAIAYLIEKARKEKYLNHDERIVLLYTLGFVSDGGRDAIHHIISVCADYDARVTDGFIKGLKTGERSCMGCFRVRQKIKNIPESIKCKCKFADLAGRSYACPLLHAGISFERPADRNYPRVTAGEEKKLKKAEPTANLIKESAIEYIKLKNEYKQVLDNLKAAKSKVLSLMRELDLKRIDTDHASVILICENGIEKLFTINDGRMEL